MLSKARASVQREECLDIVERGNVGGELQQILVETLQDGIDRIHRQPSALDPEGRVANGRHVFHTGLRSALCCSWDYRNHLRYLGHHFRLRLAVADASDRAGSSALTLLATVHQGLNG